MSPFTTIVVNVRRIVVKRPWIHWMVVVLAAVGVAASLLERSDQIGAVRDTWGETASVWVATRDLAPGDPADAEPREVPLAVAPDDRLGSIDGLTVRQNVGAGEILVGTDVVASSGPQALTPDGWLAVPIVESPASGAAIGDRVQIASDGIVVSGEALVVGRHDDVTVIAVPHDEAPLVPAAAQMGAVTLLLVP